MRKMRYKRLKRAILQRWDGNPDQKVRTMKQLRCEGRSAKAVEQYSKDFLEKLHSVEGDMGDREAKDIYLSRIPDDLADRILSSNKSSTSAQALIDVACSVAQKLEDRRTHHQTTKNPGRIKCPACFRWRDKTVHAQCSCGGAPAGKGAEGGTGGTGFNPRPSGGVVHKMDWEVEPPTDEEAAVGMARYASEGEYSEEGF